MVDVYATDEMLAWYRELTVSEANAVDRSVRLLAEMGVALEHPHSSSIKSSRYPLRELRATAGHSELRVIYAFDPRRDAALIIGGNKSGNARFYDQIVPVAEKIWEEYLAEQKAGKHG
ncbi:MAG: type II toxin-antitoxin system RelE/ParE family toxin [Candidatus Wallbacteria bacterium]|nr:type II toxin-antitoxin system RelE/ParE family toxin [Candidatus Wallbacteria bacterium]